MKRFGKYEGVISLFALFMLTPLLIYCLALQPTVRCWVACEKIQRDVEILQASRSQSDTVGKENVSLRSPGGTLFDQVLPLSKDYGGLIEQYTPYITKREDGFTVHTDEFILQGAYIPLLRIIDAVEQRLDNCNLVSLSYQAVAPRNHKQVKKLKLTLVIQYLSKP